LDFARFIAHREEWDMRKMMHRILGLLAGMALTLSAAPALAQSVTSVDPNAPDTSAPANTAPATEAVGPMDTADVTGSDVTMAGAANPSGGTYKKDDVIGAAEGVFGKGAKGLAEIIENILRDQGEPNAYIAGREVSGAIGVGLRYGSGTMSHTVEGQRPVYWTGPSLGFDLGGDATKTFVLVYNLYDGQDLYRRYPQVEGRAYFVGGFSATYLRRGNVAIIPVRLGVGIRLGANVGYMKFSQKSRWLPF
jgi:hypothetical protein